MDNATKQQCGLKVWLLTLLLPCLASAGALETRGAIQWQVFQDCNISVSGTDQVSTAYVDSQINIQYQDVLSLDVTPWPFAEWDTIGTKQDTFLYALPDDFQEGGLIWCIRYFRDEDEKLEIMPIPIFPIPDVAVPEINDPAKYVMALHGQLVVHPIPSDPDTFVFCYRSMPVSLATDTSTLQIDYKYRQMVLWRVCAAVKRKQGLYPEGLVFEALYTEAKRKRTATKTTSEQVIE